MRAIFISYRRDDAEGQAGRLFKDLTERFGSDAVFMDVVDIEPGRDFRRVIDQQVASCGVLLAMMGREWVNAKDESGQRRLDDPSDFVRLETAAALKRDIPVIPVLVQGARMPRADQLPPDLHDLAFRNAVELTHARWSSDVEVLINALRQQVGSGTPVAAPAAAAPADPGIAPPPSRPVAEPPTRKGGRAALLAGTVGVLVLAGGGYLAFDQTQRIAAEKAAAEITASRAQAEKAAAEAAAERASSQAAIEKAQAEAIAAKSAAEQFARRAESDRLRADARAQADKAAADKASAQAAIERAQAEAATARLTADEANRRAEAEKVRREQAAADATARGRAAKVSPSPAFPASPQSVSFEGKITVKDPCTDRTVSARGTTRLTIRTSAEGVVVQEQFRGSSDTHSVSFQGSATFPQPAPTYDVPIGGEWRVDGRLAFSSRGIDRVYADPAGVPTGDRIQRLIHSCLR